MPPPLWPTMATSGCRLGTSDVLDLFLGEKKAERVGRRNEIRPEEEEARLKGNVGVTTADTSRPCLPGRWGSSSVGRGCCGLREVRSSRLCAQTWLRKDHVESRGTSEG